MTPAREPPAIVQRMSAEIAKAMKLPANAAKLEQLALPPVFDTSAQFAASPKDEQQMWSSFIRQHNITPD
jgi:tripartite-type tricarboxylate transporter receptor subunit TctC